MTSLTGSFSLQRGAFRLDTPFALADAGVTALCGASGAGKTSFLRCVAGLERPAAGQLIVGDEVWFDATRWVPPHERAVGYVTQEPNLFTHLTVQGNLQYGVKRLRADRPRADEEEIIEGLGLRPLLSREVTTLSGGERQRVAIARALMRSPRVLLLDEPVSALDLRSRTAVLRYIEQTLARLQVRCLYVSHDLKEATRFADELIWMEAGRIAAQGAPHDVLTDLHLPFAEQEDAESLLTGTVEAHELDVGLSRVRCAGGTLWLPSVSRAVGETVQVQIAARDVSIALAAPQDVSILNVLQGTVVEVSEPPRWPSQALVRVAVEGGEVLARITRKSAHGLALRSGLTVWALVKSVAIAE